jgi:quercetin dioxygenase-like cupin family protein
MQTVASPLTLKDSVRAFPGGRFHFRLTSAETANALAVMDVLLLPGSEPVRHIHSREDETIVVHSGEIDYFIGDEVIHAKKGDTVFLPRGVPHHFKVVSPKASVTVIVTPGGFEYFFEKVTVPFEGEGVPPVSHSPLTEEKIARIKQNSELFGVRLV